MRKYLNCFCAALLAVTLAACGAGEKSGSVSDGSSAASGTSSKEESTLDSAEAEQSETPENAITEQSEGTVLSFEAVDLDGNPVLSEDIFSENKITMVNIWGTFCGPCIGEMPGLEELGQRLAGKECGIIGIVCDVQGIEDKEQIAAAKEIIQSTGVTYRNLLPWDGFETQLPAMFIPMTYFVTADGKITGEPSVGANSADAYEAMVDALLES